MLVERSDGFACFGARCEVRVQGADADGSVTRAVAGARAALLAGHATFTRFDGASELARLNRDPRKSVRVSALMARFAEAVVAAARATAGLVDGTLLRAIEEAGYRGDLGAPVPLELSLGLAPPRRPAGPAPDAAWRHVVVEPDGPRVRRPPGVQLDSGGLVKGLLADVVGERLGAHAAYAVDCAGDLMVGGTAGVGRRIDVADPFGGGTLHAYELAEGAVATSGITRRSWLDARGRPAHHLLDPATGRPAFTGVVQVTALAPTALEAEVRSKAALLSGPGGAEAWLTDGGVVVLDDGRHRVVS